VAYFLNAPPPSAFTFEWVSMARVLRPAAVVALGVGFSAASNSMSHEVNITVDGEALPFLRCVTTGASLQNLGSSKKQVRLICEIHSSM